MGERQGVTKPYEVVKSPRTALPYTSKMDIEDFFQCDSSSNFCNREKNYCNCCDAHGLRMELLGQDSRYT